MMADQYQHIAVGNQVCLCRSTPCWTLFITLLRCFAQVFCGVRMDNSIHCVGPDVSANPTLWNLGSIGGNPWQSIGWTHLPSTVAHNSFDCGLQA